MTQIWVTDMKPRDETPAIRDECSDAVWALIPWYVNKSLPPEEAKRVRDHAATCPDCTAEIARQADVAEEVAKDAAQEDGLAQPMARSWENLRAQIVAENRARQPQRRGFAPFQGLRGGVIALVGTVAVACLVVVVQIDRPGDNGFQTLTSPADADMPVIKFQAAPDVTRAQLAMVLDAQGATLLSGPTEQGIYTAGLLDDRDVQAAATALMAAQEILFAAPEGP